MNLSTIHCYLTHPAKGNTEQPRIGGTAVPRSGRLYQMLKAIFDRADTECDTEISFNHTPLGLQQNDCRNLLLAYLNARTVVNGRKIGLRLQSMTMQKSGLGLLFLMFASESGDSKLVLSRFPADHGILAEEAKDQLRVEFLDKVFMKSATAYKAAVYRWDGTTTGMWVGRAVDKQINNAQHDLAQYWIQSFLDSELRTTSAAGTKRLAVALRTALNGLDNPEAKAQITAAVTLARSISGKTISVSEFAKHFGLSEQASDAIRKSIGYPELVDETFRFDQDEFFENIAFRTMELSNGGILSAEARRFDQVFRQERVSETDEILVTTQGRIVDQRMRKVRP